VPPTYKTDVMGMRGSFSDYTAHMYSIQDNTSARMRQAKRPVEWYAPHLPWLFRRGAGERQKAVYFFYPHAKLEVACPPLPRCASFCGAGTSSRADHPIWSLDDLELEPLGRG
jgi:hypothetical protein